MARHPLATWPMGIAGKYLFGKAVTSHREICTLTVFADAAERISGGPAFVAAFGPKLARRARGRKRSGRNRDRADALGSPLHRETPGHRENGGLRHRRGHREGTAG